MTIVNFCMWFGKGTSVGFC